MIRPQGLCRLKKGLKFIKICQSKPRELLV